MVFITSASAQECGTRLDTLATVCYSLDNVSGELARVDLGEVDVNREYTIQLKVRNPGEKEITNISVIRSDWKGMTDLITIPSLKPGQEETVVTFVRNRRLGINSISYLFSYKIGKKKIALGAPVIYNIKDKSKLGIQVWTEKDTYEQGEDIKINYLIKNEGNYPAKIFPPSYSERTLNFILLDTFGYVYHAGMSEDGGFIPPRTSIKPMFLAAGDSIKGSFDWTFGVIPNKDKGWKPNKAYRSQGILSEDLDQMPVGKYALLMSFGYNRDYVNAYVVPKPSKKDKNPITSELMWFGKVSSNMARVQIIKPKKK